MILRFATPKPKIDKYGWNQWHIMDKAEKSFWRKLLKLYRLTFSSNPHESGSSLAKFQSMLMDNPYPHMPPFLDREVPDFRKNFYVVKAVPVDEPKANEKFVKPYVHQILEEDEELINRETAFMDGERRSDHAYHIRLIFFMAQYANMDRWWQKFGYTAGCRVAKRKLWLSEQQIWNRVPYVRYGINAVSAKNPIKKFGILHQRMSMDGVAGWGYAVKVSRRRDKHFGKKTKQGFPEKQIKQIVVYPESLQITDQRPAEVKRQDRIYNIRVLEAWRDAWWKRREEAEAKPPRAKKIKTHKRGKNRIKDYEFAL